MPELLHGHAGADGPHRQAQTQRAREQEEAPGGDGEKRVSEVFVNSEVKAAGEDERVSDQESDARAARGEARSTF